MSNIEKIKEQLATKYMAGTLEEYDFGELPSNDALRIFICSLGPIFAYCYAQYVDKKPTKETRIAACKDSFFAYCYAHNVDEKPIDETRIAAYKDLNWAEEYKEFEEEYNEQHRKTEES
jgi:hypothetical protein